MTPVLAAAGTWWATRRAGRTMPWVWAATAGLMLVEPVAGVAVLAVVIAAVRWRRATAADVGGRAADDDVVLFADLVVIALRAGLSLRAAIEEARRHVALQLREEADRLVASMDQVGIAAALAAADGRLEGFGRVSAGAAVSGAPVAAAVASFASTRRQTEHTAAIERARRLPVRMLLPLALLILPGFVVLAVGPAILEALARLGPLP